MRLIGFYYKNKFLSFFLRFFMPRLFSSLFIANGKVVFYENLYRFVLSRKYNIDIFTWCQGVYFVACY
jgi:hypothetical protein